MVLLVILFLRLLWLGRAILLFSANYLSLLSKIGMVFKDSSSQTSLRCKENACCSAAPCVKSYQIRQRTWRLAYRSAVPRKQRMAQARSSANHERAGHTKYTPWVSRNPFPWFKARVPAQLHHNNSAFSERIPEIQKHSYSSGIHNPS